MSSFKQVSSHIDEMWKTRVGSPDACIPKYDPEHVLQIIKAVHTEAIDECMEILRTCWLSQWGLEDCIRDMKKLKRVAVDAD